MSEFPKIHNVFFLAEKLSKCRKIKSQIFQDFSIIKEENKIIVTKMAPG